MDDEVPSASENSLHLKIEDLLIREDPAVHEAFVEVDVLLAVHANSFSWPRLRSQTLDG